MNMNYPCGDCVNRHSPLCNNCTVITHPDGTQTKPSYFVAHTPIDLASLEGITDRNEWLKAYVLTHVGQGVPVPISIVIKYNEAFEAVPVETDTSCVACGEEVPEGRQVCKMCEEAER